MRKSLIKKIISVILLVTVLVVIFMLSGMERKDSAKYSRNILKDILSINFIKSNIEKTDTYQKIKDKVDKSNVPDEKKEDIIMEKFARKYNETFRETMHACEYTVLSVVSLFALKQFGVKGKKILVFSMLFCIIYACLDEYHQTFVKGRGYELLDIKLDIAGIIIGAAIYGIIIGIGKLCNKNNC